MNEIERKNIVEVLAEWGLQCIDTDAYPVILIGIKKGETGGVLKIWRAADYPSAHIKELLFQIIEQL